MESVKREKISFKPGHRGRAVFLILNYTFLTLLMAVMIIPLLKVLVDSVDPTSYGIRLWPKVVDLTAYKMIIKNQTLYRPFLVSVFTTILGTAVGLLLTTMGAYVIIQKNMPGQKIFSRMILFTMLFSIGVSSSYTSILKVLVVITAFELERSTKLNLIVYDPSSIKVALIGVVFVKLPCTGNPVGGPQ